VPGSQHIVHTHGYKTDVLGLLATRGTECKIVSTPHGWTKQPDLKLWFYELVDRMILPFFDAVVPLSEGLYDGLRKTPGLNRVLHLIKNGVDISEIDLTKTIAEEILTWKRDGTFVIGYVGRLEPGKGLNVLIKAVKRLGTLNWRLAIVGDGKQRVELGTLAEALGLKEKVHFFGFREERIAFLKGFDAFVLPSRSEGAPRCLMEAMAAGIPVIVTNIPGCRILVNDNKTGLVFEVDQIDQLTKKINMLIANTKKAKKIGLSGRLFIRESFSAERMAAEYNKLYLSIT